MNQQGMFASMMHLARGKSELIDGPFATKIVENEMMDVEPAPTVDAFSPETRAARATMGAGTTGYLDGGSSEGSVVNTSEPGALAGMSTLITSPTLY
jgi:hypothetical protein